MKDRITPAHAGNRGRKDYLRFPFWDHPRACGEQHTEGKQIHLLYGSPPRMRGTVQVAQWPPG